MTFREFFDTIVNMKRGEEVRINDGHAINLMAVEVRQPFIEIDCWVIGYRFRNELSMIKLKMLFLQGHVLIYEQQSDATLDINTIYPVIRHEKEDMSGDTATIVINRIL